VEASDSKNRGKHAVRAQNKGSYTISPRFYGTLNFQNKIGSQTKFWEDTWVGYKPLKEHFPGLYNIVKYPHITMVVVMNQVPLNISF
jgi:hypothetical protein